jgi:excisionase family DNA binding protein
MDSTLIPPADRLLTVREAMEYLRCSRMLLWQIRHRGELSAFKVGKKLLFRRSDLDNFLVKEKKS